MRDIQKRQDLSTEMIFTASDLIANALFTLHFWHVNSVIRLHSVFWSISPPVHHTAHIVISKTYLAHVQRDFKRMKWCVFICLLFVLNFLFFVPFLLLFLLWRRLLLTSWQFDRVSQSSHPILQSHGYSNTCCTSKCQTAQKSRSVWFRIEIYLRYRQNEQRKKRNVVCVNEEN